MLWLATSALRSVYHRICGWLSSVRRRSWRKIDHDKHMDAHLISQLVRESQPGYAELEEQVKRLATECLEYYNARHLGFKYVLSGEVTQFAATNSGLWIHGNFVARPRKTGCFSFIYGPRTLFFFELNGSPRHGGIVTCTPLDDCVCTTCGFRHSVRNPFPIKIFSCGHREVDALCKMCYLHSNVLHPNPGKLWRGHQKDATFGYFCTRA